MIAIIRIRGQVKLKNEIAETFQRLKLPKKFSCVFIDEKDEIKMGMFKKLIPYVIYGKIDEKMMEKVIKARGHISNGQYAGFCRLNPPKGGFKKTTKMSAPKGVLGKNEDIAKLLEKMI
jgi:ribosomal protein L30/L7E